MNHRTRFLAARLSRLLAGGWILLLALPAILPLAGKGFFLSSDGLLHVYRLAALDQAVRSGVLYPRWFPELAFGYGHPVLNFYGPLGYYCALPFTLLGADPTLALKLLLALGLLASGLGMALFARVHMSRQAAIVAAVAYVYLPYHLLDLYLRGAVAEFLAFMWIPLILWAAHGVLERPGRDGLGRVGSAGLLLAALILTHNLSALIFMPVLIGYGVLVWLPERDRAAAARAALALALAALLSACYWLPVLAEWRYVGLASSASQGYQDHLLPLSRVFSFALAYPYAAPAGVPVTFPIGLVQLALLLAALFALLCVSAALLRAQPVSLRSEPASTRPSFRWTRSSPGPPRESFGVPGVPLAGPPKRRLGSEERPSLPKREREAGARFGFFFVAVALFSIYMLTTASLPVWRAFESGMAFLQYPWRFQTLTVLATALLAGKLWDVSRPTSRASTPQRLLSLALRLPAIALVPWALWRLPVVPLTADVATEAMWRMEQESGQIGTTWTGEYLPIWVAEQRWAVSYPEPVPDGEIVPAGGFRASAGTLKLIGAGHGRYDLELEASQGTVMILHQFHFPGWEARWQGRTVRSHPVGTLGLAAFDLLPGSGRLVVRLSPTAPQRWGTGLSLAGFLAVGVASVVQFQMVERRASLRWLLPAGAGLLPACILLGHLALPNGYIRPVHAVNANLENKAELLAFAVDRSAYRPGDTVEVTLYWRALVKPEQNYKAFVHLTDATVTFQPAQHDSDPGSGFTPTTRWLAGEIVPDRHHVVLPEGLAPGRYALWAGLYEHETVRNLAILDGPPEAGNRVFLGQIEVMAR